MRKNTSSARTRKWRLANKDKHSAYMRDYRSTSYEVLLGDPDEMWFEKDPRKRKALKQATPSWVEPSDIRRVYEKCVELNYRYPGAQFVVHHVVPISHPLVCGLHVPENLKVVSSSVKMKLGRKFHEK